MVLRGAVGEVLDRISLGLKLLCGRAGGSGRPRGEVLDRISLGLKLPTDDGAGGATGGEVLDRISLGLKRLISWG